MLSCDHERRSSGKAEAGADTCNSKQLPFCEHAPHHTRSAHENAAKADRPRMKTPRWVRAGLKIFIVESPAALQVESLAGNHSAGSVGIAFLRCAMPLVAP
jgi:hypothetical protein